MLNRIGPFLFLILGICTSGRLCAIEWSTGQVIVRNLASIGSFNPELDQTYNPNWISWLFYEPTFSLSESVSGSLRLGLSRVWTRADDRNQAHEIWWTDPQGTLQYPIGELEVLGLNISGSSSLLLPLSPASKAATMRFSFVQAILARRTWQTLSFSYLGQVLGWHHQYRTGSYESPRIERCAEPSCVRFNHTGLRNPSWGHNHTASLSWTLSDTLSLNAFLGAGVIQVYPLSSVEELPEDAGSDYRYSTTSGIGLSWQFARGCTTRIAAENMANQLRPNGNRQTLFFNRYAYVLVDLSVSEDCAQRLSKGGI